MIETAIMIEGQNGLNWDRWKRIVETVEESGYIGLYRSDHYTNANPPDKDSLELWISLTYLASHTKWIEFGPLVTPVSFRHPTMTARMAAAVDDLSDGRLILGLGAGWQEREHTKYGWDLLDVIDRFNRFEEGLEVITRLLQSDDHVDFQGEYYQLNEAILLPRPNRSGGPPILIGGNGKQKTLSLVAKYADEWNGVFLTPEAFQERSLILNDLMKKEGRQPDQVKRSMMTGCIYGETTAELNRKVRIRTKGEGSAGELRERGLVVATADEIKDQLTILHEAGVQRVMLQWLDLDDIDGLRTMAEAIFQ